MAYNREWDKGKDSWGEQPWNDHSARPNVRGRDEDYYGEGKRRKFNNGVCRQLGVSSNMSFEQTILQGYDAPHNYDADPPGHVNIWAQDDHASGFQKKRQVPSQPSQHVIFLGLDPDFTEADVRRTTTLLYSVLKSPSSKHTSSARSAASKQ